MRTRFQRKLLYLLIAVMVLIVGFRFFGAHDSEGEVETLQMESSDSGGQLQVGIPNPVSTLDPHRATGPSELVVVGAITDSLFEFDAVDGISGSVVKDWDIEDEGLTYVFHIEPGIKFVDGTSCDAEAVRKNLQRMQELGSPILAQAWLDSIADKTVVDDLTLRLDLHYPDPNLLFHLSRPQTGLVSPEAVQKLKDDFAWAPVGLGPFKVITPAEEDRVDITVRARRLEHPQYERAPHEHEKDPGEHERGVFSVELESALSYWQDDPALTGITFTVYDPDSDGAVDLLTRDFDILVDLNPSIDVSPDIGEAEYRPNFDHHLLMFNLAHPDLADARVRRALDLAVDREQLISEALKGGAAKMDIGDTPLMSDVDDSEDASQDENVEKAKQLLDDVYAEGMQDPLQLEVLSDPAQERVAVSELLIEQLQRVGVQAELEVVEREEYYNRMRAGEYHLSYWVLLPWIADPSGYTVNLRSDNYWNVSQLWNHPELGGDFEDKLDQLLIDAASSSDPDERKELLDEYFFHVNKEQIFVSLWHTRIRVARTNHVRGIEHPYGFYLDFGGAYFLEGE